MKKLCIGMVVFSLGVISCVSYYTFFNPAQAFIMPVDHEQCDIQKLEIEIDNKKITVEKMSADDEMYVMFYTGSYPYSYQLTAFTQKCGNIKSEIREIKRGTYFYERVYQDKIELDIRA